ncbi:SCO-spondin-like [Strongylocentrotus purpuratus]|uniref:VWFD domain-containing protein n=1 Tax=Strongylocentrotus purpuratus TaxID=7668 RepID=A0A7M7N1F1_STRPU|nr:SCO-spondin-like [Strongylocentrotus purpuratus]
MGHATYCLLLLTVVVFSIDADITHRRRPEYSLYTNNGNRTLIFDKLGRRSGSKAAFPRGKRSSSINQTITTTNNIPGIQVPSIPEFGYCQVWAQQHYRSFDGKLFTFPGACTYILATDWPDFSFHIYVENDYSDCRQGNNSCSRSVLIDNGNPTSLIYLRPGGIVTYKGAELTLPTKAGGLVLEQIADYILATSGLGFRILYDGKESITVYITTNTLLGNTAGLCGTYDMDPSNDFFMNTGLQAEGAYNFGLSWKMTDEREPEHCPDVAAVSIPCTEKSFFESEADEERARVADQQCSQLLDDMFAACQQVVDPQPFVTACEEDVCACTTAHLHDETCKCASFSAYALECARRGVQVSWRSHYSCPYECPESSTKIYEQCGSTCRDVGCSAASSECEIDGTVGCLEGCYCPPLTYKSLSGGCVSADQCSCSWQGSEYLPGRTISNGCNECTCVQGKWRCTQNECGGNCLVSGQGHYKTFDNRYYDFAGTCSYILIKDCWNPFSIYLVSIENTACGMEGASCVKAVVIQDGALEIRLRRGSQVLINGEEVTQFPKMVGNFYVNQPTHTQTAVIMPNGMTILFDGNNEVAVMADDRHVNSTCGLCGTYNNNHRDDFYTEAGDVEANPTSFANKWKLGSSCPDASYDTTPDPCDLYSQMALTATDECDRLLSDSAFAACRQHVDPQEYYDACRHDVCNCKGVDSCKCEVFAMYAAECTQKGIIIDWRASTPGCEMSCEDGTVYQPCHPMCDTTCIALSLDAACTETCVEGCACPGGYVLDPHGECVTREHCSCVDPDTGEFHTNLKRIEKGCGYCQCLSGAWVCEGVDCPSDMCLTNQEYEPCASPCDMTCTNMHNFEDCPTLTCSGRCVCNLDTVWNGTSCIAPSSCPCHHGGQSYPEGHTIRTDDCHTCTCTNNRWECEEYLCYAACTTWGDPHFSSFDGRLFDFEGDCDYVLATDSVDENSTNPFFRIIASNIPCGNTGITCTKAVTFTIGRGSSQEKLHLVRGKPVPASAGSFKITEVGNYVHVQTTIGVVLIWNGGTWVQVKLKPDYKEKVGGLCGNYNDLINDDFMSPAGGLPETSALDFGDSWKVHNYCPLPEEPIFPCLRNPSRRAWAMRQCSVIKSDVFKPCFSQVSYLPYYAKCVYDSCACDSGGDCECLCSAISAYAKECTAQGVPIKWRTNDLCPMQCDGCREYTPCIDLCDTCSHQNDRDEQGNCPHTCFEGCSCPDGEFYHGDQCLETCPPGPPTGTPTPPTVTTPSTTTTTTPWVTTTTPTSTPFTTVESTTPWSETTTQPPVASTTPWPETTTQPPVVSTTPWPETTTQPPVVSTTPWPETTTQPPVVSTTPWPETTTQPPVVSTTPWPETTTQPPVVSTTPWPETTTQPPVVSTTPWPETPTQPPVVSTTPWPETTTQPPVVSTTPWPETTTQPPIVSTTPWPETTTQPPIVSTTPWPETTTQPPIVSTTPWPETTTQPPETTTAPPGSTTQPPETTTAPPGSTTQPPETTTAPPGSTTTEPGTTTWGCREEVVCEWTPWCDDEAGGGKVTNTDEGEFEYIEDCRDQFDFCEEPTTLSAK